MRMTNYYHGSLKQSDVQPVYLFLKGGRGIGKSHLINSIYHTITNPENPTVLLMAPTGAININGTTMHTTLAIPKESGDNRPPLSDQKRTQITRALSDFKLVIIDEISMVSNATLLHIHQSLKEVFATPKTSYLQDLVLLHLVICINHHPFVRDLYLRNTKVMFTICAILG